MSNEAVTTIQPLAPPTGIAIAKATDSKSVADLHNEKHNKIAGDAIALRGPALSAAEGARPNAHRSLKEADAPRSVPEAKPAAALDEFRAELPLDLVVPSATNPRKNFPEQYIAELAESVRAVGVQSPIRVRPRPFVSDDYKRTEHINLDLSIPLVARTLKPGETVYEIVAGESRYRASLKAGAKTIPAVIRQMSDEQALEAQIVENLQRKDVAPIEESRGFASLLQQMEKQRKAAGEKPTRQALIAALAERLGKSVRHVYARLKLSELTPRVLEALEQGLIDASHADELVRLQPEDQKRCLEAIRIEQWVGNKRELVAYQSVRWLKEYIAREVHRDLAKAGWGKYDAGVLPAAGACGNCDKRTGAAPELHPEVKPGQDFCLDARCYEAKGKALVRINIEVAAKEARQKATADAEAKGKKSVVDINVLKISPVASKWQSSLSAAEQKHVIFQGHGGQSAGFVECKPGACEHASPAVFVEGAQIGQRRTVCAISSCKVHFAKERRSKATPELAAKERAREKREAEQRKLAQESRGFVMNAVLRAALAKTGTELGGLPLRLLLGDVLQSAEDGCAEAICEYVGIPAAAPSPEKWNEDRVERSLAAAAKQLTDAQMKRALIACCLSGAVNYGAHSFGKPLASNAVARELKLDVKAVQAKALAEFKEQAAKTKAAAVQTSAAKKTAKAKPAGKAKSAKKGGRR